jgi:hypothetical protein
LPVAALPRAELVRVGHYVRVATGPCDELDEGARAGTAAPSETFVECRCRGSDKPIDTGGLDGEARCTHVALHRGTPTTSAPRRTLWWVTTIVCAVGVALAVPEWVPRGWTREDGPVEYAGFACFLGASALAFVAASRTRRAHRPALAAAALGAVLLVAAGEEISWGQRLFGVETPAVLVDGNRQDELNLHNIDGLQQKAIIGQLAIAGAGVLLPWFVPRPWARSGLSFFAGYLAYRGARGVAVVVGWGPAGRNTEAAELVLALGVLALTAQLAADLRRPRARPHPPTEPSVSKVQPTG